MNIYIYYIYAYLREDGTPYYIGKGKGNRAYSKQHSVSVPKDKLKILFLETDLSEIGALALERRYIRWYGRKDNGTGILRNMTDGGEGCSGMIHDKKFRQNISLRVSGKNNPMFGSKRFGELNPFFRKQHTEKSIIKIKQARKKQIITKETKQKWSNQRKGKSWCNNGIKEMLLDIIPVGWQKGRLIKATKRNKNCMQSHSKGKQYYNDGTKNFRVYDHEILKHWNKGMLPRKL